jgi:hypothetical protein
MLSAAPTPKNTTIKFKWWHRMEAGDNDDDGDGDIIAVAGKEGGEEQGEGGRRGERKARQ